MVGCAAQFAAIATRLPAASSNRITGQLAVAGLLLDLVLRLRPHPSPFRTTAEVGRRRPNHGRTRKTVRRRPTSMRVRAAILVLGFAHFSILSAAPQSDDASQQQEIPLV